jgi:hypothetical protein
VQDYRVVSQLLTKGVVEFGDDNRFEDFFKYHTLGIPLAYFVVSKSVEGVTEEGIKILEDTWTNFCTILGVDPSLDWTSIEEMKLGFMFEEDENFEYFMYESWEGKSNKYFSQNLDKELNLENIFKLDDGIKNVFEMNDDVLINKDCLEFLFLICCSLQQYNQSTKENNSTFELGFFENLDEQERITLTPWPTYWYGIEKNELIKSHIASKQYSQGQFAEAFIRHELYDDSESDGYVEYEKNIVSLGKHYIKLLYEKGNEFLTQEGFEHFGNYYIIYEEYDEMGDGISGEYSYFASKMRFRSINKRDIELFFKPDSINHIINLLDAIDSDYIHEEFYLELKLIIKTILEVERNDIDKI